MIKEKEELLVFKLNTYLANKRPSLTRKCGVKYSQDFLHS